MRHYLGLVAVLVGFSSCGARVVAIPSEALERTLQQAGVKAPAQATPGQLQNGRATAHAVDASEPDSPSGRAPAGREDPSYSPSQVVADDLPADRQSGPASVLIDAPEGSTATYRLDDQAPVETGLSFELDGVEEGEHTLQIEVTLPDGQRKTFDSTWTQIERTDETSAVWNEVEGADTSPASLGAKPSSAAE